ncbi:mRNA capping enzyme [Martensiomyces pterosporus]|nr:mRNA capping enzyme [Martensiomyces pterosporus]
MADVIPGVPGHRVPYETTKELRALVGEIAGTHKTAFPGAQPISFTKSGSIPELMTSNYYVCEKSDGVRVLVLMLVRDKYPQTYFITRKNEYLFAPHVAFPVPNNPRFDQFHDRTLIDAELVIDVEPDGRQVMKLLGFDTLVVNGFNCMERTLDKRLGYLNSHIFDPYKRLCAMNREFAVKQPFMVEMKKFEFSYGVERIYSTIIPQLKHKSDGLIFTSQVAPYTPGTCEKIIKWKPANENSIDFKIRVQRSQATGQPEVLLYTWHGSQDYQYYDKLAMTQDDWNKHFGSKPQVDGLIVEAVYDPEHCPPAKWKFMRFRDDKPHGNHISVVSKIIESIGDSVELNELIGFMPLMRSNWKQRNNLQT